MGSIVRSLAFVSTSPNRIANERQVILMNNKHGIKVLDSKFSRIEIQLMKEKEPSMPTPKAKSDVVYSTARFIKYPTAMCKAFDIYQHKG